MHDALHLSKWWQVEYFLGSGCTGTTTIQSKNYMVATRRQAGTDSFNCNRSELVWHWAEFPVASIKLPLSLCTCSWKAQCQWQQTQQRQMIYVALEKLTLRPRPIPQTCNNTNNPTSGVPTTLISANIDEIDSSSLCRVVLPGVSRSPLPVSQCMLLIK